MIEPLKTIKILKKGALPTKVVTKKNVECPNCHTIFEYVLEEYDVSSWGNGMYIIRVRCPLCNNNVDIEKDTNKIIA